MLWPSPLEWFNFTMFVVSVPLYLVFLVTIIKFRHKEPFNSPFFTLCVALGVGDFGSLMNNWFLMKFQQFDWFGLGQFALSHVTVAYVTLLAAWEFAIIQHVAVTCLAVNRFVALVTPDHYERVWTTKLTAMVIIFEYVLPLPAVLPLPLFEFGYIVDNQTGSIGIPCGSVMKHKSSINKGLLTLNGLTNGITLVLYCIIFYKIHQHMKMAKKGARAASNQQNRADVKLAVFGFCVFCVMFVYGVYSFLMATHPAGDIEAYRFNVLVWATMNDIFSSCNAWLIIVCSKKVRGHMWALVRCQQPPNQVAPIPPPKKPARVAEQKL